MKGNPVVGLPFFCIITERYRLFEKIGFGKEFGRFLLPYLNIVHEHLVRGMPGEFPAKADWNAGLVEEAFYVLYTAIEGRFSFGFGTFFGTYCTPKYSKLSQFFIR